jgi:hypothetical protein
MNSAIAADIIHQILEQSQILDQVTQVLQRAQNALPSPDAEEVALLWEGGSLSVAAHVSGLLQRVILSVENAASDLRTGLEEETLSILDQIHPSAAEIHAIESALDERMHKMDRTTGHPDEEIVRHLLSGCLACRQLFREVCWPEAGRSDV